MQNVCFINKPKNMTSFDVCYKMRKVLNTKVIGHTGTLDPNAQGVMVILFDKTCKANSFLVSDSKEYIAEVEFGYLTDTLDIDGKIIERNDNFEVPSESKMIEVMNGFIGKSFQRPPMTSAIKINGKKLYEYQRANQEVEIPLREIEVFEIELLSLDEKGMKFRTKVSSGTYIRSLFLDIIKQFNLIGTLVELTRTKIDNISIDDCDDLNDLLNGKEVCMHPLIDLIKERFEIIECDEKLAKDIKNGKAIKLENHNEKIALISNDEVLAIYGLNEDGFYHSIRGLF